MNSPNDEIEFSLQIFVPDPNAVYTIKVTAELTHIPRRMILVYHKHGLISPVIDPEDGGYYFNDAAIRTLRRVEYLHTNCGINLEGTKMILDLMNEVERLEAEARSLRTLY